MSIPQNGARIRFKTVPIGSYATAGEVYRVTVQMNRQRKPNRVVSVSVWDEKRNCGTFDSAWAWSRAEWETV